jgi:8-oxo-dGTP pyrophosphatase MutT (NUDIX family)
MIEELFAYPVISLMVLNHSDALLLQKRWKPEDQFHNFLELPQGRLRRGEHLLECARRELKEETGLNDFIPINSVDEEMVSGADLQSLETVAVNLVGRETYLAVGLVGRARGTPRQSEKAIQHRWHSASEVDTLLATNKIFPLNVPMLRWYVANYSD